ncbi:MAG: response regulator transcription factor [Eubacteriaceae bacterium]
MYKILIIEDDEIIANSVKKHIQSWGCIAECANDFGNVLHEFADFNPHLVLLDISLPLYNGYYWCSEIRKTSKVPIIFISSSSDNMNIVMAMNMGADDFIAKPFDINVLTAKIQAMLRRAYDFTGYVKIYEHKGAILNTADNTLTYYENKIDLSKNEYKILRLLMENKGSIVSRDAIMTCLWETDVFIDDNTLTVNITRLRKKLEDAALTDFINTKKGLGYIVE